MYLSFEYLIIKGGKKIEKKKKNNHFLKILAPVAKGYLSEPCRWARGDYTYIIICL